VGMLEKVIAEQLDEIERSVRSIVGGDGRGDHNAVTVVMEAMEELAGMERGFTCFLDGQATDLDDMRADLVEASLSLGHGHASRAAGAVRQAVGHARGLIGSGGGKASASFAGAAGAWETVTLSSPSQPKGYECLAVTAYAAGQARKGDLASAKALSLVPKAQQATVKPSLTAANATVAATSPSSHGPNSSKPGCPTMPCRSARTRACQSASSV